MIKIYYYFQNHYNIGTGTSRLRSRRRDGRSIKTRNARDYFSRNVREDARHDAILKMRKGTKAHTRGQLWRYFCIVFKKKDIVKRNFFFFFLGIVK